MRNQLKQSLHEVNFNCNNKFIYSIISFRPNLIKNLKTLNKFYEIFIYSHGLEQYKDEIIIKDENIFSNTTG